MSSTPPRSAPDRCPGALSTHRAADGPLARVRLPGGLLTPTHMSVLAVAARELGNGSIELTSRGNAQLRAVRDTDEFAHRLADAGLLPSPTHERVRNVLASPLTGRVGGLADVHDLIARLDAAICADPELAALPGRTLFALDDGRGDVAAEGADFGVRAVAAERYALMLAGLDSGLRLGTAEVVDTLIRAARSFVDIRGDEWRLSELADGPTRIVESLGHEPSGVTQWNRVTLAGDAGVQDSAAPPVGWLPQRDGRVALGGALALGILDARLAEFLAAVDKPLVVTPWRSLVICDLDDDVADTVLRVLAPMGLIFDENSPWLIASACTGSPGCDKSLADVRGDLTKSIDDGLLEHGERQHWSGCERRCGRPKGEVLDIVAGPAGYRVS
ncbi:MAG: precorrin-3B synthase [Rhodococcus sp. (in: high G+C Gram-positive bacteria)]